MTVRRVWFRLQELKTFWKHTYQTEIKNNINLYLVPTEEGEYLNIAFSNTGDYTYIRSEADENSEWVGKLYSDSAAVVLEYLDGWTKIRSGNAEGYVPTETLFTGEEARSRSDEYIQMRM